MSEVFLPIRRALLSVSDKTGLIEFATGLAGLGVELLSTGGTAKALRDAGLSVVEVADVTDFPEILGGRVKTLHPKIHGGILARADHKEDDNELNSHGIQHIDMVVVNLYPFEKTIRLPDVTDALAAENIDIGGPTMLRAAAKNWFRAVAVSNPDQYTDVLEELVSNNGRLSLETRRGLALSAFALTSAYDSAIVSYLTGGGFPDSFTLTLPKAQTLRYGENPHQQAALYGNPKDHIEQLHGKELSFNNMLDLTAALALIRDFEDYPPTVAIFKHTNPCGVATADSMAEAYHKAFATDRESPFGGIVVVNRSLDLETAQAIDAIFTEIIIAPDFEDGVLDFLRVKANRRLIRMKITPQNRLDIRSTIGGLLVQESDRSLSPLTSQVNSGLVVTRRQPTEKEWNDLDFAWRVCKHVKSNAIVYARDCATLGIGAGQMSRIDSSRVAVDKAARSELSLEGAVIASDAFFPFADGLLAAVEAGARAVVQPGGSVRDEEVIAAANENDLAMIFTGERHFRH